MLGQYFTPPEAAAFVLDGARLLLGRRAARLLDPACGDGVFLELALARGVVTRRGAYGIELDPRHVRAAGRLGLNGRVVCADALAGALPASFERARRRGFDLVVGNPPFGGGRGKGRLELRFAARFAELAASGGAGGVILPVGVFANASCQALRDSLLDEIHPAALVELPAATFHRTGAAARTCALFFRKGGSRAARAGRGARCLMVRHEGEPDAPSYFDAALGALGGRKLPQGARRVAVGGLNGRRWDPGYWCSDDVRDMVRVPLAELGGFIEHITYGPIVTGERGARPERGGVRVVGLREIRPAGLDLRSARRVRAGGIHDPGRCRLEPGDVVLARSGAGSLMKGRVAVFGGGVPATVGCFVDLVRLAGLEPGYAALALRSRVVRVQVERLANGVGTPNLSFAEIGGLLVPRLGRRLEGALAREEAAARKLHDRAISRGREPEAAARRLASAVGRIEKAALL
ncbi:MAG: N-6 DNA methylase, partial [Planctomycetota bacterium]|jgi:predicted RNA methylase